MTKPELTERILAMRAKGLTLSQVADHLNLEGIRSAKGLTFSRQMIANTIVDCTEQHVPSPQDILAKDPTNTAAIADLEDRQRYFSTGNLSVERIRAINKEYQRR